MQSNEEKHKKAGGDLDILTNCVTTNTSAIKVAGQRQKCLSNSYYYRVYYYYIFKVAQ